MAAQRTRAYIAASGDYYFCPLPSTQVPTEELHRLLQAVWTGKQPLMAVDRPAAPGTPGAEPQRIAEAYQYTVPMEAQVEGCRVT